MVQLFPQVAPTLNCNHPHAVCRRHSLGESLCHTAGAYGTFEAVAARYPGEGLGLAVARHTHDPVETKNERELALDKLIADGLLELMNE